MPLKGIFSVNMQGYVGSMVIRFGLYLGLRV